MRIQISLLMFVFLFSGTALLGQQQSVVIIDTEGTNGYGVAWGGPGKIVTALHVVAGQSKIRVRWGNKTSAATVEKIYKPADLALLSLETKLPIPLLELYPSDPSFGVNMNYWEVPSGPVLRPAGKTTQLEERTPLKDINTMLAKKNAAFDKGLCKDAAAFFPELTTAVFKFAEPNIKKSHSGTPLTFQNKIVGLVDGGSGLVAGKSLVWAIPATEFEKLLRSGVAPPPSLSACDSKALYSGLRSDNPLLSEDKRAYAQELENADPIMVKDDNGNELVFSLEFRGSYEDLFYSMFEEDQQYLYDLIELEADMPDPVTLEDLYGENCDILVEENSGATIAYPSGRDWKTYTNKNETFLTIDSPGGGVSMIVQANRSGSVEESKQAMEEFISYLLSDGRDWVTAEDDEDLELDFLDDEEDPLYLKDMWREVRGDDDEVLAELFATLEINESDFLGVAVIVNDWDQVNNNPEERKYYYLMEACTILTGFAYN